MSADVSEKDQFEDADEENIEIIRINQLDKLNLIENINEEVLDEDYDDDYDDEDDEEYFDQERSEDFKIIRGPNSQANKVAVTQQNRSKMFQVKSIFNISIFLLSLICSPMKK